MKIESWKVKYKSLVNERDVDVDGNVSFGEKWE